MPFDKFIQLDVTLADGSVAPVEFGFWRTRHHDGSLSSERQGRSRFRGHFLKHFLNPTEPWDAVLHAAPVSSATTLLCGQYEETFGVQKGSGLACRLALSRLWRDEPYLLEPEEQDMRAKFCQTPVYCDVNIWIRAYDAIVPALVKRLGKPAQLPRYGAGFSGEKHYLCSAGFVVITRANGPVEQVVTAYFPFHEPNWRHIFATRLAAGDPSELYKRCLHRAKRVYAVRAAAREIELIAPKHWNSAREMTQ
ncbi:MAG: hypothetical protein IT367_12385 [Candidatus Hydrogenedentes bacterium]|nr:hypothetical protein [Candidatus Hydrogenedentota bacterium]